MLRLSQAEALAECSNCKCCSRFDDIAQENNWLAVLEWRIVRICMGFRIGYMIVFGMAVG